MSDPTPITLIATLSRYINKHALNQACKDYEKWASSLSDQTDRTKHGLELLKHAEQRSGMQYLKEHRDIIETIAGPLKNCEVGKKSKEENNFKRTKISRNYEIEF